MSVSREEIFFELHSNLPREGPGDDRWTRIAMEILRPYIPGGARILDIGCGPGAQTLCLAEANPNSPVFALDNHEPYLDELKRRASERGLANRINVVSGNMESPEQFETNRFDLLWSEGAIYSIGFDRGLNLWSPYLKRDGCFALTELTWLKENPPLPVREFWQKNYPGIRSVEQNLAGARKAGFAIIGHFVLPELAWFQNYYTPLLNRIEVLRKKYDSEQEALSVLNLEEEEIRMFERSANSYGYVFYLLKKVATAGIG